MPGESDTNAEATEAAEQEGVHAEVERTAPCECVIRIQADADYLQERYQQELAELQADVQLPGFRRGKAPVGLVERRMGSSLRSDLVSSVVGEAYDEAVHENDLTVVAETEAPDLEELEWELGDPLEVTFRCEVMPELELTESDYKGLQVEAPDLEPTEEMLEQEMERFARQFATWEEVSGAGIDWDDHVTATVSVPEVGWQEEVGFYPRTEVVGPFQVEGVKGALIGAEAGDQVELEGRLAEGAQQDHPELEPIAAQTVALTLKIASVVRHRVPEVDDELAQKMGLSGVEEVRSMLKERLDRALGERKEEVTRDIVRRRLLEKVELDMPESLVERADQRQQARMLVRLLRSGVPRDEAEQRVAQAAQGSRRAATRSLKDEFILRRIAEQEKILVTESEVDSQIRAFASRQGWRENRARDYLEEQGMVRALRDDMRESKTLDFLIENAEVREIPVEEFQQKYGAPQPGAEQQEAGPEPEPAEE